MNRQRKRWRWGGLLVLAAVALALSWSGWTYLELARLEVEIADACSRVEAAGRGRAELAGNLLETARGLRSIPPEWRAALEQARERALLGTLDPDSVREGDPAAGYRKIQRELSLALARAFPGGGQRPPALDRAESRLSASLAQLDRIVEAYRSASGGFPASIVTAVAHPERARDRSLASP